MFSGYWEEMMETGGMYRLILSKNLRKMSFLREAKVVRFSEDSRARPHNLIRRRRRLVPSSI